MPGARPLVRDNGKSGAVGLGKSGHRLAPRHTLRRRRAVWASGCPRNSVRSSRDPVCIARAKFGFVPSEKVPRSWEIGFVPSGTALRSWEIGFVPSGTAPGRGKLGSFRHVGGNWVRSVARGEIGFVPSWGRFRSRPGVASFSIVGRTDGSIGLRVSWSVVTVAPGRVMVILVGLIGVVSGRSSGSESSTSPGIRSWEAGRPTSFTGGGGLARWCVPSIHARSWIVTTRNRRGRTGLSHGNLGNRSAGRSTEEWRSTRSVR